MRNHKRSVLVTSDPQVSLNRVVTMLNRKESSDLRRLVTTWRDSGPNLQKMLDADRTLNRRVENVFSVSLLATKSGRAHLALVPSVRIVPPAAEEIAILMFVELVLNPWWEKP